MSRPEQHIRAHHQGHNNRGEKRPYGLLAVGDRGNAELRELTVTHDAFSERRTSIEHHPREYVLEAGGEEECSVLRVPDVGMLVLHLGRLVPWLLSDSDVCDGLHHDAYHHKSQERDQDLSGYEVCRRSLA